jgi:DNA-binding MarR family transcriptional regulator
VAELSTLGYIQNVPNPIKRNSKVIQITAHGEALIAAARRLYAELDDSLCQDCAPSDIERLINLLGNQFSS